MLKELAKREGLRNLWIPLIQGKTDLTALKHKQQFMILVALMMHFMDMQKKSLRMYPSLQTIFYSVRGLVLRLPRTLAKYTSGQVYYPSFQAGSHKDRLHYELTRDLTRERLLWSLSCV